MGSVLDIHTKRRTLPWYDENGGGLTVATHASYLCRFVRQLFFDVGVRCYFYITTGSREGRARSLSPSTGGLMGLGESQTVSHGIEELVERSRCRSTHDHNGISVKSVDILETLFLVRDARMQIEIETEISNNLNIQIKDVVLSLSWEYHADVSKPWIVTVSLPTFHSFLIPLFFDQPTRSR